MRARDIVGKRVIGIEQARVVEMDNRILYDLYRIYLSDGSYLTLSAVETEVHPIVTATVTKPKKGKP